VLWSAPVYGEAAGRRALRVTDPTGLAAQSGGTLCANRLWRRGGRAHRSDREQKRMAPLIRDFLDRKVQ